MHGRIALAYDCGSVVLLSSVIPASPTVKYATRYTVDQLNRRTCLRRAYRPAPAPGKKKQMEDDMGNGATAWSFTSHWFWEYLWTTGRGRPSICRPKRPPRFYLALPCCLSVASVAAVRRAGPCTYIPVNHLYHFTTCTISVSAC
jgi:hypothetical protein